MVGYLGQFAPEPGHEYENYTQADWALEFVGRYGQFDGGHHKAWVLDQVARILNGTKVIVEEARWDNGQKELRFWTDEPSKEYLDWVAMMKGDWDEENEYFEYDYDEGIAP